MSNGYLHVSGATLVWPNRDTEVSVYRVNTNGSYTLIGTSSSSVFSIVQYSGIHMKYVISSDSASGYSNVVEVYLPLTSDVSGIHGSEYLAAAMESTMTGQDIKTILHTYHDAFDSPVFSVPVSNTMKLVDTFTEAYDSTLPVTVVLCKDGSAIDIPASYIQNGELIYFAGSPGAILTYNILDDVSVPNDSTSRVRYYPDSDLAVQQIPGSTTIVVRIDDDAQGVTIAGVNYRLHSSGVMIPFGPNGLMVSLVGIGSWVSIIANSCTFSVSGTVAWLTGLNNSTGTLTVPASFIYESVTYNVLGISGTLTDASGVTNLIFDASSTFTTIPASAFVGCTNLSSITLPPGITTIESGAFDGRSTLTTITNLSAIPLTTIGLNAFRNCSNLRGTLPSTLTSIGAAAFFAAGNNIPGGLVSLNLKLISLGTNAFVNSNGISGSFDVSGLTAIPATAFDGATNLQNIFNTQNLTSIGTSAFRNCHRLVASFSSSITSINDNAFSGCNGLGLLTFAPMSLSVLGASAFGTCVSLSGSIDFSNSSITTIPGYCFGDCSRLRSVIFSSSITTIANSTAFQSCSSLSNISFYPNSQLTTIGNYAFSSCPRLSGTLPSTIRNIGIGAFNSTGTTGVGLFCPTLSLQSLGIDAFQNSSISGSFDISGLTAIPTAAFNNATSNASNIHNLFNTQNLTSIGANAFNRCNRLVASFPSSITNISGSAFQNCSGSGVLTFAPMSLSGLGTLAFSSCTNLSGSFDLSRNSTLTTILPGTFTSSRLSSFTISPSITTLSVSGVFNTLPRFTTLNLDVSNVSYLDVSAINCPSFNTIIFQNTSTITTIPTTFNAIMTPIQFLTLPDSATTISGSAFLGRTSLIRVDLNPTSQLATIGTSAFNGCTNLTTITNLSAIPLTTIRNNAFQFCSKLVASFSSSLKSIGDFAFKQCDGVGVLTFAPMSLSGLGAEAFHTCTNLSGEIDFSNSSITAIPYGCFNSCSKLRSVIFSSAITTIGGGNAVFTSCALLSNISFYPNSQLTTLGYGAFYACPILSGTLPSTLRSIGQEAFLDSGWAGTGLVFTTTEPLTLLAIGAFENCSISGSFNVSGLTAIPDRAFTNATRNASNIHNLYNTQNLTSIGANAFNRCNRLVASFSSGITDISGSAFQNCSGPGVLTFAPMSLSGLGLNAFQSCANLSGEIDFSNSTITTITAGCFGECSRLQSVKISSNITRLEDSLNSNNNGGVFSFCASLSNISFYPNSQLTYIGRLAFNSSRILTGTLPSTITDISYGAFLETGRLATGLVCPTLKLKSLGAEAFNGCSISGSFDVSGLTVIPDRAFNNATFNVSNLHNLFNTQNLTSIGPNAFNRCNRLVASFPSSITDISDSAFQNCNGSGVLTFAPMSLRSLGLNACNGCTNLSGSFDLSRNSTLTTILPGTFNGSRLSSITISPSITTLSVSGVFNTLPRFTTLNLDVSNVSYLDVSAVNCPSFNTVIFQNTSTITTIPNISTFMTPIQYVTLPDSVTTIGPGGVNAGPFQNRTNLIRVDLNTTSKLTRIEQSAFNGCTNLTTITNISAIPLTHIEIQAFDSCHKLVASFSSSLTYINNGAFINCSGTGLLLFAPMSLTTLGSFAFLNCTNLSGTIDFSNSTFSSFSTNSPFGNCRNLQSVRVSSNIVSITGFGGCSSLSNISFYPSSQLATIGASAFESCPRLSYTFPSTITSIGASAFQNCSGTGVLTFAPMSLSGLGLNAFQNCTNLSGSFDLSRNSTLTTIAAETFTGSNLVSFTLSPSITTLPPATVFKNLPRFTTLFLDVSSISYLTTVPTNCPSFNTIIFRNTSTITSIPNISTFMGTTVQYVTLPDSATSIAASAFLNRTSLIRVNLNPTSQLVTIGDNAFGACTNLTTITNVSAIPLTTIGAGGFANCHTLVASFPSSITSIGNNAFITCGSPGYTFPTTLMGLLIFAPMSLSVLGERSFENCLNLSGTIDFSNSTFTTTPPTQSFIQCRNLQSVKISSNVTRLEDGASSTGMFYGCASLSNISFYPNSNLTYIGSNAFVNCPKLSGTFPSTITDISTNAFQNCGTTGGGLVFPPLSLRTLGGAAFANSGISGSFDLSRNSTLTTIQNGTFTSSRLSSLTLSPSITTLAPATVLNTLPNFTTLFLDVSSISYLNAAAVSCPSFNTIIFHNTSTITSIPTTFNAIMGTTVQFLTLPDSATSIAASAFQNRTNLIRVSLNPTSQLATIGSDAFNGCTNLTTITNVSAIPLTTIGAGGFGVCHKLVSSFPSNITDISANAFLNCSGTGVLTFAPMSLRSLGASAWNGCVNLSGSIDFSNSSITTIPSFCFGGCTRLQSVRFSDSATTIAASAFSGNTSLNSVTLHPTSQLATIGDNTFNGCIRLTSLSLPSPVTDISNNAFLNCSGGMSIQFAGLPPVLTASGSLNTTRTMFGVYPSDLENQWLPLISGGLFRNLRMRSSQMRIVMTTTAPPFYNLSSVVFSLSGTPNTVYTIYDGSALSVSGDMTSITMSRTISGITDGSHSFYATLTDVVGNDVSSTPIILTIDTIAPNAPTLTGPPYYSNVSGATIGISGELQTTYTLYLDDSLNVSGTVVSDTTVLLTNLSDGSHNVYVTLTDAAGNVSAPSDLFEWIVDTITPSKPTLTGPPYYSNASGATIGISGELQTTYTLYLDDSMNVSGTVVSDTTVLLTNLSDGSHNVYATLTDATGHVSAPSDLFEWIVDTIAPSKPMLTGPTSYINASGATIGISGELQTTYTLYLDGSMNVSGTVVSDTTVFLINLSDGSHNVYVTLTDAAGNVSAPSDMFVFMFVTIFPSNIVKPLSKKALRASSFPSSSMRTKALAGREMIRSYQSGAKRMSGTYDIHAAMDAGRIYIRNNLHR